MQAQAALAKDPGQVAFFVGNLCQEADLIYRFGYSLTLSEKGGARLVMESYQSILGQLDQLLHSSPAEVRMELVQAAWRVFQSWNKTFDHTPSACLKYLEEMSIERRIIITLIDALGFTVSEAAKILEFKELEVRRYLADARKRLIHANVWEG